MEGFPECFDVRQFVAMRLFGDALTLCDAWHGCKRDAAVGAWKNCWWHWVGRSAWILSFFFLNTDTPYVCFYEELGIKSALATSSFISSVSTRWIVSLYFDDIIAFSRSWDSSYNVEKWTYWARDEYFDLGICSSGRFVFIGRHGVVAFSLSLWSVVILRSVVHRGGFHKGVCRRLPCLPLFIRRRRKQGWCFRHVESGAYTVLHIGSCSFLLALMMAPTVISAPILVFNNRLAVCFSPCPLCTCINGYCLRHIIDGTGFD